MSISRIDIIGCSVVNAIILLKERGGSLGKEKRKKGGKQNGG